MCTLQLQLKCSWEILDVTWYLYFCTYFSLFLCNVPYCSSSAASVARLCDWLFKIRGMVKLQFVSISILSDSEYVKAGLNVRWNVTMLLLLLRVFKTSIKMLYCTFYDYIMSILSESMFVCCWIIKSLFMLTYDLLCDSSVVLHSTDWLLNVSTMQCHYGKVMNIIKFHCA